MCGMEHCKVQQSVEGKLYVETQTDVVADRRLESFIRSRDVERGWELSGYFLTTRWSRATHAERLKNLTRARDQYKNMIAFPYDLLFDDMFKDRLDLAVNQDTRLLHKAFIKSDQLLRSSEPDGWKRSVSLRLGYAGNLLAQARNLGSKDEEARKAIRDYAADIIDGIEGYDDWHLDNHEKATLFNMLNWCGIEGPKDIIQVLNTAHHT